MSVSDKFNEAIKRFDEANARDPNKVTAEGLEQAHELLYSRRLFEWVLRLAPKAPEALLLAARCQHICRWEIPRSDYEMDRTGYLKWRTDLKKFHAQRAGEILAEVGYPEETVARVQALNLKKELAHDPDTQVLEDALCLMFLQHQFTALAAKTTEEKIINAIRKTWKKMSPAGHAEALKLDFPPDQKSLIDKALA